MRQLKIASLLGLCVASSGCLSTLPIENSSAADKSGDHALGSVALYSERLGHSTIAPNTCRAGDRAFFLGGDFIDAKSGFVVRLVFDPLEGAAIRIFANDAATEKSVVFRRVDCRTLKYALDPTRWRVNDVYDYGISVTFECARSGDAAKGAVSASHCH